MTSDRKGGAAALNERVLAIGPAGAALLVGRRLEEIAVFSDASSDTPQTGAIFLGRVGRRLGGDAFIDLGDGQSGFLPNAGALSEGDTLRVEVARPPEGDKAARLQRRLTFRSRLAVLTVGAPGVNVSKSIADAAERRRLEEVFTEISTADGWVIRTAAAGAERAALTRCRDALVAARRVLDASEPSCGGLGDNRRARAGRLLRPPPSPLHEAFADWPALEATTLLCADAIKEFANDALTDAAPHLGDRLRCEPDDPWERLDIHPLVDALRAPRVELASGWMMMERTAALIAIDVNAADKDAASANLSAAREIPRQLRLRGWGGMVAVDFAGDPEANARDRLVKALKRAADPALRVVGWGPIGLLEATRRRDRTAIELLWPGSSTTGRP